MITYIAKNFEDREIIEEIKKAPIYIYGAGDWGRRLYIWCEINNIIVENILVSNVLNNPENLFDCKVEEYDSNCVDKNRLLIVAVNNGSAVATELKEGGFNRIVVIESLPESVSGNNYYRLLKREQYPYALKQWFKTMCKQEIDLKKPLTFNEKIQWLKLYGDHERMACLADKFTVRQYVEDRVGKNYLIELLGVWDRFDEIDFDILPEQFVIKCNHGCGYNIIVKNKKIFDKNEACKKIEKWMNEDYGLRGFETHYSLIKRKIIVEKYIEQLDGGLYDYKIHCFKGQPKFIQVIGERNLESHEGRQIIMDTEWREQTFKFSDYPKFDYSIEKPNNLAEMLEVSRLLSKGLIYARVDLYVINNDIKFGEITLTPGNGIYSYDENYTEEDAIMLGKYIELE